MSRPRLIAPTILVVAAVAVSACGSATGSRPLPTYYQGGAEVITPLPGQASAAGPQATASAAPSPTPGVGTGQPSGLGTPVTTVSATAALQFSPATSTIKVGQVLQWTNTGSVAHNVTFDNKEALTSPTMNQNDTWQVQFSVAGTYAYHCTFHPGMNGSITVTS